ncbi:hypothetical protein ACU3L3_21630 [Priestia endophytica]|uniref:Uncharacterized protein n=1 Tax=Priestia endophytica DSM 13796 TaxID=1121089 RepID=A0A1I5XSP1_9BACI|nr:hypothetical protein [Priestia endophytica]KYG31381.1 hypothetical protein AZF06_06465 [Priestia endophytica]MBG9811751.1 hypothetical protein [Priestia endophytica]SFQ34985.1 hypothetical protein SAMN02745910_01035 [Priestia endophytica DSM 13796]
MKKYLIFIYSIMLACGAVWSTFLTFNLQIIEYAIPFSLLSFGAVLLCTTSFLYLGSENENTVYREGEK